MNSWTAQSLAKVFDAERRRHAVSPAAALAIGFAVALLFRATEAMALDAPQTSAVLRYESFIYPDADGPGDHWENFLDTRVRGVGRLGSSLTYQFEARAVADDANYTAGVFDLGADGRRRPYFSLISAVLAYQASPTTRLSVGRLPLSWSGFDVMQPLNLLRTPDESDVFRQVDYGVYGFSVDYTLESMFAALVVVPFAFTPTRLPQGRWQLIRDVDARERDTPPVRFEETQAALRVGLNLRRLEAALVGYVGRDSMPYFVPNLIYVGGDQIFLLEMIERYARLRAVGVTASHPVGENGLVRAESVFFGSPESDRDDFVHSVVGFEYALAEWRFVINYLRDDTTNEASEEVTDDGQRRFFSSFVFGEVRFDAGTEWFMSLRGGYDLERDFWVVQPEVSRRILDAFYVILGADIIAAQQPSYFYSIRREDRLGLRLEYYL